MKIIFAFFAVAVLAGCASQPFTVSSDFDREIDYSGYQNYAWVSENPMIIAEDSDARPSPLTEQRIMRGIETEMKLRGFNQLSDPAEADFVIAFTIGTREKLRIESYPTPIGFNNWNMPYGWNYPYGYGGYGSVVYAETTRTSQYVEGTLSIDIFDIENRRPVWHGQAQGVVRNRDRQEERDLEARAIQEIHSAFPPL